MGSLLALTGGFPALVHEVLLTVRDPSAARPDPGPGGVPWASDRVPHRRPPGRRRHRSTTSTHRPWRRCGPPRCWEPDVDVDCVAAVLGRGREAVERTVAEAVEIGLLRRVG